MMSWRRLTSATTYEGPVRPSRLRGSQQIFDYLRKRSPSGARNVLASIRATIVELGEQPYSGYATDDPDVRVRFIDRYLYKIFYRVRADSVEIIHIRHTARRSWQGGD